MRPITSLINNPPRYVSELINTALASWNEQLVRSVFVPIDAEAILSIPLCTRNIDDFWAWSGEKRGLFTVKSAYNMILQTKLSRENWIDENDGPSRADQEGNAWSGMWRTEIPSKVKFFVASSSVFDPNGRPTSAQKHGNIGGVQVVWSKGLLETCFTQLLHGQKHVGSC